MAAAPCIECGRRSKALPRQRCAICLLRHEPIGEQIREARRRREMVPAELRPRLTKAMREAAPAGTRYCASCCSYRDEADFRGAKHTQCWACRSERSHAAMTKRVYGLDGDQYEALLELQGGRCAICGNKPKKKRLAVDHDHKTGAVRGLACSACNHDLLGAAWDSLAKLTAAWHYLNTPPASGDWLPLDRQPSLMPDPDAVRPPAASGSLDGIVAPSGASIAPTASVASVMPGLVGIPIGSEMVPGKRGVWRVYVEPDGDPPF